MAPSEEHINLQNKALAWLANKVTGRGLRGGLEIPVSRGYVSDAVAVCDFQHRFQTAYYGRGRSFFDEDSKRLVTQYPPTVCVFEAKAFIGDFQSTFGQAAEKNGHCNRWEPVGTLHWVVVPKGAANAWAGSIEKMPHFWGVLEVSGSGLREVKKPTACEMTEDQYNAICAMILWYQ